MPNALAIVTEYGSVSWDPRLTKSLHALVERLAPAPGMSFPKATSDAAALERCYRLLNNRRVQPEKILEEHVAATVKRIDDAGGALVVHDTTEFTFPGSSDREGLGGVRTRSQGFLGHFALAVSTDGRRRPLGMLGYSTWTRTKRPRPDTRTQRQRHRDPQKESNRWPALIQQTGDLFAPGKVVHIADREGDSYELFAKVVERGDRFVIRLSQDRAVVDASADRVSQVLERIDVRCEREVTLSARSHQRKNVTQRNHPERRARIAKLGISASQITIERPNKHLAKTPASLTVNIVHVRELETPPDQVPVDWRLVTTEPIDTAEDIVAIVDMYRARWVIEEYFKALKTGCAYEKRQLDNLHSLLNALAVFVPIALQLLQIRSIARDDANEPADRILSSLRLRILRATAKARAKHILPPQPTVADAMRAIAALGGHIRGNGQPGWQVLWRGFQDLLLFEVGWQVREHLEP